MIAGLDVAEIVFVRGNHEDADWWNFQDAWEKPARKLTLVETEFASNTPCLPVNMTARADLKNETVVVYPPLK